MDPLFLQLYNSELQYLREAGGEFAREFPKIAGRLALDEFECSDPYVERLLEGVAFLTARIQRKIDAQFPRFTQHLLEMVYPHYLAPTPSMLVARFFPDMTEGSLADGYAIPRGTALRSQMTRDQQTPCTYLTAHPITLWPLEIASADYFSRNVAAVGLPTRLQTSTKAGIRFNLKCTAGLMMNQLSVDRLPIFLCGDDTRSARLYEQVFANCHAVLIRTPDRKEPPAIFDRSVIRPMGFEDEESLLPARPRSFSGYRLLQEYFAFPHRFYFFELSDLQSAVRRCPGDTLEIILLFTRSDPQLENVIDAGQFALHCAPAVNLFPQRADRIHLDYGQVEYHVVPDRTRPVDLEVYEIEQVRGFGENSTKPLPVRPFYSLCSRDERPEAEAIPYYTIRRDPRVISQRQRREGPRTSYVGSEAYVTLVDSHQAPFREGLKQLDLELLCTNRDLPLLMPLGLGRTDFVLEIGAPVTSIRCAVGPSPPRPPLAYGSGTNAWRLLSHLTLNYLSLADSSEHDGAAGLRELLALYADPMASDMRKLIDGVRHIDAKSVVRRLPIKGPITFGRGVELTLTFDESEFEGFGVFLLGAVLSRFFARYVTLNAFTETVLRTNDRGEIMRWPTRIGRRDLI